MAFTVVVVIVIPASVQVLLDMTHLTRDAAEIGFQVAEPATTLSCVAEVIHFSQQRSSFSS